MIATNTSDIIYLIIALIIMFVSARRGERGIKCQEQLI